MAQDTNLSPSNVSEITQKIVDHLKQSEAARSSARGRSAGKGLFFFGAASAVAAMARGSTASACGAVGRQDGDQGWAEGPANGSALKEELEDITAEAGAEIGDELPPKHHEPTEKA
jgi:hypothetical protein